MNEEYEFINLCLQSYFYRIAYTSTYIVCLLSEFHAELVYIYKKASKKNFIKIYLW